MKAQTGVKVQLYTFFNLGTRWGWLVNVTPQQRYPPERPGTPCMGGWVDPRAGVNGYGKSRLIRDSILGPTRSDVSFGVL